jgi:hypothetical protein
MRRPGVRRSAGPYQIQARGQVGGESCLKLAVRDGLAHVRNGGTRGDRPVHPPHVVTGPVLARLTGLRARPRQQPDVVALQQAVELARDEQLELRQCRLETMGRVQRGMSGPSSPRRFAQTSCRREQRPAFTFRFPGEVIVLAVRWYLR